MAPSEVVSAENFGARLRSRRMARQWSQPELARRSGVKKPTIVAYEAGRVTKPGRDNVVALALALDWPGGVNAALSLLDEGPLSAEEQLFLPAPVDLFEDVTRLWPQLSPRLQAAVVELLSAICEPHGAVDLDPVNRGRSREISTPREPVDGDQPEDHSRCECS